MLQLASTFTLEDTVEIRFYMPDAIKETKCFHCGETCSHEKIQLEEKYFCCQGCKLVYELLNEHELCAYYNLNTHPGTAQRISIRKDKFVFLDDEEVVRKLISFTDGKQTQVTFYLPQMHCSSCLWLLENMHKLHSGIVSATVNFLKKEIFIVYQNSAVTLRNVVETLTSIGYEPHVSLENIDAQKIQKVNKSQLYKLGVAGFCFANIMMMSLPEYFSRGSYMEQDLKFFFKYFIVLLSLPVLFYSASGFFLTAWGGIKNRYLNIDAPIALAIGITFARSLYEIASNSGSGYLDSMSGIVFFMLLGRIVQDKTYQSISFDRDYKSFFPVSVNLLRDGLSIPTVIHDLKAGDLIQIFHGELIPVDGIVSKGNASIDYSFVSGESIPVSVKPGEIIYAGGKQMGSSLELMVVKEMSQSYLTNLWNKSIFKEQKKVEHSFIHLLGKYFTFFVVAIALLAAVYWYSQGAIALMLNTITTVLIVACPCALLLSSTFTNGNILRILGKNKFYLRHPDVIEELGAVSQIVFDKTGTLTRQNDFKVRYSGEVLSLRVQENISSLLVSSAHPLSKSIVDFLNVNRGAEIDSFRVVTGSGIEGWMEDEYYQIGSYEFIYGVKSSAEQSTSVYVKIGNTIVGKFILQNSYRFGFSDLLQQLKKSYSLAILSGDNSSELNYLRSVLKDNSDILFQQKPEEKLEYIQYLQQIKHQKVAMVGDGLNDAGALRQSNVGIAIAEHSNNFTPSCDAILDASQFSNLNNFFRFARAGKRIIQTSFVLSVVYNIIGLYFALQGTLSPLIAAILMPASSISIILITYGLSELTARKYGLAVHD